MKPYSKEFLQSLVENPHETLQVEIKRWIDPDTPEGISKIVKACIAMRNNDGGFLVIGFDNKSGQPDLTNIPQDVRAKFNIDKIQGAISKYSSERFEIDIHLLSRNGQEYPIISVSDGVKTPVATKSELPSSDSLKPHIPSDTVYVRTFKANNIASTSKANWSDWGEITRICFENREADLGKFLRRHLIGLKADQIQEIFNTLKGITEPEQTDWDKIENFLNDSMQRFQARVTEEKKELPSHGSFEISFLISGQFEPVQSKSGFLDLIAASNPRLTGWPLWVDSRRFSEEAAPHLIDGAWEALIIMLEGSKGFDLAGSSGFDKIDFWRIHPDGFFYQRRGLEDDLAYGYRKPQPETLLDYSLPIFGVAEAITVGLSFAKAMKCDEDNSNLLFVFRWNGLQNRQISSWAGPIRNLPTKMKAYQDEVLSKVFVPTDIARTAIYQKVHEAVAPLFEIFDGYEVGISITEELTKELLNRSH